MHVRSHASPHARGGSRASRASLIALVVATLALVAPAPTAAQGGDSGATEAAVPPEEFNVTAGYQVRTLVSGLDFPTAIAWDANGTAYVATAGFAYGVNHTYPAQVLRVLDNGSVESIADGFDPPIIDLTWHEGALYLSERGRITRLEHANGTWSKSVVVDGLPAFGDHHTNEITFGPDGRLYFGQGTTTNSAVVGLDNLHMGWTRNITEGSDRPCEDVTLAGYNYVTDNPWEGDQIVRHFERAPTVVYESEGDIPPDARGVEGSNVTTGAYVAFGTPTHRGQTIPGQLPCSGAILSVNPDGSGLDWYAWGLRNPFGVKFDDAGRLHVADNMYDTRGSRPVGECPDHFWRIEEKRWYGWPDYCGGVPVTDTRFELENDTGAQLVLMEPPSDQPVPAPLLNISHHASADKFDFAPGDAWGDNSTVYMALFGDMTPVTGRPGHHSGMAVVSFDAADPAEPSVLMAAKDRYGGDFRPVEAIFGPDDNLYVVHIGAVPIQEASEGDPEGAPLPAAPFPMAGTGAVYVVEPTGTGGGDPGAGAGDDGASGGGDADGGGAEPDEAAEDADTPLPAAVLLVAAGLAALLTRNRRH